MITTKTPRRFSLTVLKTVCTLLCLGLLWLHPPLQAQSLGTWNFEGDTNAPTTNATNTTAGNATFGPGLSGGSFVGGNGGGDAYSATGWTTGNARDTNDALSVTIVADDCYLLDITGFTFDERRSGTGPGFYEAALFGTALDGTTTFLTVSSGSIPDNTQWRTVSGSAPPALMNMRSITLVIYGTQAESSGGTWRFDNIEIQGTVKVDDELPVVTCDAFMPTYNQPAPPPNTPSGIVGPVPSDGMVSLGIGFPGSVPYTLDLTQCITDLDGDYSEYGLELLSSLASTIADGCGETITNTYEISDECGNIAEDNIIVEALFTDNEPPVMACIDVEMTFTDICGQAIFQNNPNSNIWVPLTTAGTFSSVAGGSSVIMVDVSDCLTDDNSALDEMEFSTLSSTRTVVDDCTIIITNTYRFRDACGNIAANTLDVNFRFVDDDAPEWDGTCDYDLSFDELPSSLVPIFGEGDSFSEYDDILFGTTNVGNWADCVADCYFSTEVTFTVDAIRTADDGCTATVEIDLIPDDPCGNTGAMQTVSYTFTDNTAPTVNCGTFTPSFDSPCPGGVTANNPSPMPGTVVASGMFSIGLGFPNTVFYDLDLTQCIEDADGDYSEYRIALITSVLGNNDGCSQTLTNTYEISDACGNVADNNVVIEATFEDTTAPAVTCTTFERSRTTCPNGRNPNQPTGTWYGVNDNGTFNHSTGGLNLESIDITQCVSDDCTDIADMEVSIAAGYIESTEPNVNVVIIQEYSIRDACGNVAAENIFVRTTYTAEYEVDITCPADAMVNCDDDTSPNGTGMATAVTISDRSCDNIVLSPTFSDDDSNATCNGNDGTIVRTFTATAPDGTEGSCVQTITIENNAPEVTCAASEMEFEGCPDGLGANTVDGQWFPVGVDGTFMTTIGGIYTWTVDVNDCVSDDCTDLAAIEYTLNDSYIESSSSGAFITIINEIRFRDECGQEASTLLIARGTVTAGEPTISCPADLTVECGDDTMPTSTGTATAMTACGDPLEVTFSDMFTPDCGNTGTIERTFSATDENTQETVTCTQTITIEDNTAPMVTCTDFTMTFEGCPQSLGPNMPNGEYFPIGLDGGFTAASGGSFTMFLDLTECVSDNCSDLANLEVTLAESYVETRTDCLVTLVNEFFVRDECGNVANDRIITRFTIENTSEVEISCPADLDIACGSSTDPADTGMATAEDACGEIDVTFEDEITMQCNNGGFVIIRTWMVEGCNGTATCSQVIILRDEEAPVFDDACETEFTFTTEEGSDCPLDATISLNIGDELDLDDTWTVGGQTAAPLAGCVSDNCALDEEITVTVTDINMELHGISCTRAFVVTFVADDGCGNDSEPFTITYLVVDDTAPEFDQACAVNETYTTEGGAVCPNDVTVSLSEGDVIDINTSWAVGGEIQPTLDGCLEDNCVDAEDLNIVVTDITQTGSGCATMATITFTPNDGCNNAGEPLVMTYTFLDDTAPVFDQACAVNETYTTLIDDAPCPDDVTISINEGDVLDINDTWTVGGFEQSSLNGCLDDNCIADEDLNIVVDDITFTGDGCDLTVSVTFLANDGCGNVGDPLTMIYNFEDDTPPTINWNGLPNGSLVTLECDLEDEQFSVFLSNALINVADNCNGVTFTGPELVKTYDGPCVNNIISQWTSTWVATDDCGNETVYTLLIDIEDNTPPVWIDFPADVTISCTDAVPTSTAVAFDVCSELIYDTFENIVPGSCPNNYTIERTFVASDGCGNANVQIQNIVVVDEIAPEIELVEEFLEDYDFGDVFIECGNYGAISALGSSSAVATDNCSEDLSVEVTFEDLGTFDCNEFGYSSHLRTTWTTEDECGNVTTEVINWFLTDETAPVLQGLPEDTCADINDLPPVPNVQAVDQCEFATLEYNQSDILSCEGVDYIERTWTASDLCGNTTTASQRIYLTNGQGPTVSVNLPGLDQLPNGSTVSLSVDCTDPNALDIDAIVAAVEVSTICLDAQFEADINLIGAGDCAEDGYLARYRLTVEARDVCGNQTSYELIIDFVDDTLPTITGESVLEVSCGDNMPMPIAEDACGPVTSLTFEDAGFNVSCPNDLNSFTRTWTAVDACGNVATLEQTITVIDDNGPVFSGLPEDGCEEVIDAVVTAMDECTGEAAEVSMSESTDNVNGCGQVLTRTWTATDACGNTSTASRQYVLSNDEIEPELSFNHPLLVGIENGGELYLPAGSGFGSPDAPFDFTVEDVIATDNCNVVTVELLAIETTIFDDCEAESAISLHQYIWTATDPCGNITKIGFNLYYIDETGPDVNGVPANVTIFCADPVPPVPMVTTADDYDENPALVFTETQESTDEGLLITRSWTATDDCGNSTTESYTILIVDNTIQCNIIIADEVVCNTDNNLATVDISGGTAPYSILWETIPDEDSYITSDPTNASVFYTIGYITQQLSVTITDANGCVRVCTVDVSCILDPNGEGDVGSNLVSDNTSSKLDVNVYPNPASDQLRVSASVWTEAPVQVYVFNTFGQIVLQQKVDSWPQEGLSLDTSRLPAGTYLMRLERESEAPVTREIVILR